MRLVGLVMATSVFCIGAAYAAKPSPHRLATASRAVVSFRRDIQPIFNENCVACHQSASAEQGLNLESGKALQGIRLVPSKESSFALITPAHPEKSYLLAKVAGSHLKLGGRGARMPPGDELTAAQIAQLNHWIAAGAPAN